MSPGSNNNSSNNNPRQIVIDDNDHVVHYKGAWSKSNGKSIAFNHKMLQVVPYDNSLHGTQGDGSFSFSYSFNGSTFGNVMGFADVSNSSGVQDPSWECVLDDVPIHANDPPGSPTNQFSFCSWDTKQSGKHKITVNVKSQGKQLFFNQITYVPDPLLPVKNVTVLVGNMDDALMFHEGLEGSMGSMKPDSRMAMGSGGSVVTFPFFGTDLGWFGKVKNGHNQHMPTGFYSIDNQPPINFTVNPPSGKGSSKSKSTIHFFQTPHLSLSNHTITVTSFGESQSSPLPLSYLVLNNGQLPQPPIRLAQSPSPLGGASSIPDGLAPYLTTSYSYPRPSYVDGDDGQANDSGKVSNPEKNFPFKHIIAALGATLFLVFLAGCILCIRRRRRRSRIESPESATPIVPTPTGSSSISAPPPYTPPQNMSQVPSPEYPFASAGNSFSNFTKRFTSSTSSTARPNSLFGSFRPLSPLPTKRISFASSAGSSTRTYSPYVSRARSNTQSSTGSTATLLPNESISERGSEPPSRKGSLRFSFPDDRTVVEEEIEHKEGHMELWHAKPPGGRDSPPPSDGGG